MNITMEDIMDIMNNETVYETAKKAVNERIKGVLDLLQDNHYEYIARDKDDSVYAYHFIPEKVGDVWLRSHNSDYLIELTNIETDDFKFPCKWEDSEAIKTENLMPVHYFYAIHKPNRLLVRKAIKGEVLHTLNGDVVANEGDYVITGVNGEQYPCDPEIFKKLYDVVD